MRTVHLIYCLLLLTSPAAMALDTTTLSNDQLHRLARELEPRAGSSQWQQLWQNMRRAGYFNSRPGQLHLAIPQAQLPALARQTLAEADQAAPLDTARVRYRKDFSPRVIGRLDAERFSALCLEVDWRAVPQSLAHAPKAYLGMVGLLQGYPCL
ncbi:hypothetical protein QEM13_001339 [Pseudomonas putida]|nr:hypothetical protein [Pseudomonas putida]